MKINAAAILFAVSVCTGCAHSPSTNPAAEYAREIILNESQLEGLDRAKRLNGTDYTYAVSTNGHWGYIGGTGDISIRGGLSICQHYANQPCRVHFSGDNFTQERYEKYSAESWSALQSLKKIADKNYHDETTDWNITAPPLARPTMERMKGPTPLALPGIRTIRTAELVQLIRNSKPIIIDAEGYENDRQTIPNAFLIDWIGVPKMSESEEAAVFNRLNMVMNYVEKDKNQPIVVSCESSRCWLSVFAALRIRELGYNDILWYRGGKLAWEEAGLPLVRAVPYATLWDNDISWPGE